jgi:hypothetical protein
MEYRPAAVSRQAIGIVSDGLLARCAINRRTNNMLIGYASNWASVDCKAHALTPVLYALAQSQFFKFKILINKRY